MIAGDALDFDAIESAISGWAVLPYSIDEVEVHSGDDAS